MANTTVNIQQQQNIFDIAVQEYGGMEGLFDLLDANDLQEVSHKADVHQPLCLEGEIVNRNVYAYYKANDVHPATGITQAEQELFDCLFGIGGIGCMIVGNTFIIGESTGIDYMTISEDFYVY